MLAAPAWTAMMREVYERRTPPAAWPRPDGLTALDIDKTTGYKATPFCPKDVHYIESFIPGTEPTAFCPIHSPFGSVGGVMGGESRRRLRAPRPATAPAAPTAQQTAPGAAAEPPAGGGTYRRHGGHRPARPPHRSRMRARRLAARWVIPVGRSGDRAWGGADRSRRPDRAVGPDAAVPAAARCHWPRSLPTAFSFPA